MDRVKSLRIRHKKKMGKHYRTPHLFEVKYAYRVRRYTKLPRPKSEDETDAWDELDEENKGFRAWL